MVFSYFGLVFPHFPLDKLTNNPFAFAISREFRFYLPVFVYSLSLLYVFVTFFKKKKIYWEILYLIFYGLFSYRTSLGGDFGHLMVASIPTMFIIVWILERSVIKCAKLFLYKPLFFYYKIAALCIFIFGTSLYLFLIRSPTEKGFLVLLNPKEIIKIRQESADTYNPTLRVWLNYYQHNNLNEVLKYLNNLPQKVYYTTGSLSGLYFLTKSQNNFYYDQDYYAAEEKQKKIIQDLEKKQIKYIVKPTQPFFLQGSSLSDYVNFFYDPVFTNGEYTVVKRNEKQFGQSFYNKGLIETIQKGWQKTDSNTFILSLKPTTINKIKVYSELSYYPILHLLGKEKLQLGIVEDNGNITWFSSDTNFIPQQSLGEPASFHLNPAIQTTKIILFFSSPGGLNPAPININLKRVLIYQ